jgi:6-phosphogluconate dehydrogenase
MNKCNIGLIGLGVMGKSLALNMESKGFSAAVYNRTWEITEKFTAGLDPGKNVKPARSLEELVSILERPRRIMIMIEAGKAIDAVIGDLAPLLHAGDVVIDGGNSLFTDSQRRFHELAKQNIHFIGMGVSGGEEGALKGPSLMPGGTEEGWKIIAPIFTRVAAQVGGEPCARYLGPDGAGHYVKMVHNGIEYAEMQLICEAYDVLSQILGLDADRLAEIFAKWNEGDIESYLIEITAQIFRKRDPESGEPLVDLILDRAKQKGTGMWTLESAIRQASVVSTINAAVDSRILSSKKAARTAAAKLLPKPESTVFAGDRADLVAAMHDALYAAKLVTHAQGMDLLRSASTDHGWNLDIAGVATIWRGGCIIRSRLLERIKEAFESDPKLDNLLLAPFSRAAIEAGQANWRNVIATAVTHGIAIPALSASLAYFDSLRRERLPANLLQAQRDFFGAHKYERVDRDGEFHTDWQDETRSTTLLK